MYSQNCHFTFICPYQYFKANASSLFFFYLFSLEVTAVLPSGDVYRAFAGYPFIPASRASAGKILCLCWGCVISSLTCYLHITDRRREIQRRLTKRLAYFHPSVHVRDYGDKETVGGNRNRFRKTTVEMAQAYMLKNVLQD